MVQFVGSCKSLVWLNSCRFLEAYAITMRFCCMFHQMKCCISVLNLIQIPIKMRGLQGQKHKIFSWWNMVGSLIVGGMGVLQGWVMTDDAVGLCHDQTPENFTLLKKQHNKKNTHTDPGISFITDLWSCLQPLSLKLHKACLSKDSLKTEAHWQILINQSDIGLLLKNFSLFSWNLLLNMLVPFTMISNTLLLEMLKGERAQGRNPQKKVPCKLKGCRACRASRQCKRDSGPDLCQKHLLVEI